MLRLHVLSNYVQAFLYRQARLESAKKKKKKKKAKAKQHPKAELSLFEILLSSSRYHPKVRDFLKNVQNTSESVY